MDTSRSTPDRNTPVTKRILIMRWAIVLTAMALAWPVFTLANIRAQQDGDPMTFIPAALHGQPEDVQPLDTATPDPRPSPTDRPPQSPMPTDPAPTAPVDPTALVEPTSTPPSPVVVVPRAIEPEEWFVDSVTYRSAAIDGHRLDLTITYGGGCHEHDFWLVASSFFMESEPPQVDVLLSHDAYGDMCRALITRDLSFDLRPLARNLTRGSMESGTLILRLRGWDEGLRYDF